MDQKAGERTFQANMERRMALLLGEAMGLARRVRRATAIGNNSVQVSVLMCPFMDPARRGVIKCPVFGSGLRNRGLCVPFLAILMQAV